ncbi:hypothetical protein [Actinospongicola halichondriae]|uniref:hypothetical protein n=1 Tax=Actinospongicola halichondriae TaxID=3236844 RepID=UPI003D3F8984
MKRLLRVLLATMAMVAGVLATDSSAGAGGFPDVDSYNELFTSQAFQVMGDYVPIMGVSDCGETETVFILWYAAGTAPDHLWTIDSLEPLTWTSAPVTINGTYEPLIGDFDGDNCDDLFWYAAGGAVDYVWYNDGDGTFTSEAVSVNGAYRPVVSNFDEGADDILWYAPGSGNEYFWTGQEDRTFDSVLAPPVNGDYRAAGSNGSVLFHKPGPGQDYIWGNFSEGLSGPPKTIAIDINGSYTPLVGPLSVLLYAPGSAQDHAITGIEENGDLTTVPATINGDYTPAVRSPAALNLGFLWHAPGAASDHFWILNR